MGVSPNTGAVEIRLPQDSGIAKLWLQGSYLSSHTGVKYLFGFWRHPLSTSEHGLIVVECKVENGRLFLFLSLAVVQGGQQETLG